MAGEVLEGVAREVLVDLAVVPRGTVREHARAPEGLFERDAAVRIIVDRDLAGREVDAAVPGVVGGTDIHHEDVVNEDPQVVVAVELVDHRAAVLLALVRHHEAVLHGHAEVIVQRGACIGVGGICRIPQHVQAGAVGRVLQVVGQRVRAEEVQILFMRRR